jgi:dephospho-CoA kinase
MSALKIGLTGGLASGKSTVAGWLREAGLTVIDADQLVAELYRPPGEADSTGSAEAIEAVSKIFGPSILAPDGGVDHRRVAARVFSDPEARHRLEAAIHPLVRARFAELAKDAEGVIVLEATLLVEAGFAKDFDIVVSIETEPDTQLVRSVGRGLSEADARARLAAQGDGKKRRAGADLRLENDGSLEELRHQVDELAKAWTARAAREAAEREAGRGASQ